MLPAEGRWNQDAIVAVDGERVSSTKKSTGDSVKGQGVFVVFFDWKGIVYHEFVPRDHMVNKQFYQEILARLRNAVRRKRPEFLENQTWMLHHDSAPAHASLLIRSYLAKHQTSVVPHQPYSPDLVPANFFLFVKLETTLKDVVSKP